MGFKTFIEKKGKNINVWDLGYIKFAAIFFGIIIGAYMPFFVRRYIIVFIGLAVLLSIKPVYDAFR